MLRSQLSLMFHKKSFWISLTLMISIACFFPTLYLISGKSGFYLYDGYDITLLYQIIGNPYIFYYYSDYSFFLYYLIPVISLFPFAFSYCTESRSGYSALAVSRSGIKAYLTTKAICSMIGVFLIFFIASLINLLWSLLLMPEAFYIFSESIISIDNTHLTQISGDYLVSQSGLFTLEHPVLSSLAAGVSMSAFAAVCALCVYTFSLYIKQYAYLSSFPLIIILIVMNLIDNTELFSFSIDPMTYACSGAYICGPYLYFIILIAAVILICFMTIRTKAERDLIP